eukprot:UN26026
MNNKCLSKEYDNIYVKYIYLSCSNDLILYNVRFSKW